MQESDPLSVANSDASNPNYEMKLAALKAAIEAGDASGIAKGDVFARIRKALNLPS
jgi:hypothetical protein